MFRLLMRYVLWGSTTPAAVTVTFATSWAHPIGVRMVMVRPVQVLDTLIEEGHTETV